MLLDPLAAQKYIDAFLAMPGTVALFPLQENGGMGTTYRDVGRNRFVGTASGTMGQGGLPSSVADLGIKGDGTSAYIDVPDNNALDLGDNWTISAIIMPGATGAMRGVASKPNGGYYMRLDTANKLNLLRSQNNDLVHGNTVLAQGRVYHAVGSKAGSTVKIYLNGKDDTGSVTNATTIDNANVFRIGADCSSSNPAILADWVNGRLAMVGLHSRGISNNEAAYLSAMAFGI
jgi:hypothetical protein